MVIKTKNIDTKLKMGREFIKQISITTDDGSVFDRASLMKIIKGIQQKFIQKGKNVKMMVSMPTNFGQMRSAKSFSQTEDPLLVEDYEWENGDTVSYFSIYIWETPRNQNFGETENNDCLFNCLTELYGIYSFHPQLKTDAQLKKKLNLKETDKIPLKLIPTVEKLFGVNINIQNIFTSEGKYNKTANLECNDEHLTVIKNNGKNRKESSLLKNMSFGIKKLILVRENKNNVLTYDGEKELTMSWDEYNIEKQKSFKEKYTYATSPIQNDENSIQMDYNIYIEENEKLKTESKGKYNLEYAGWKIPNLVQQIIYNAHIGFNDPEEPTPKEQEWLSDSFMGGLIRLWANKEKYDNAYLYDINSSYPATLCDEHFTFPVKQGVFTKIDELPEIIQYGIYRCTIDAPFNSTFKTNKKNKYTHIELNLARKKNLDIKLIIDDEANALLYSTNRANGSTYFKNEIHNLYSLKQKGFKLAKLILNTIWGALCKRNKIKRSTFHGEINLDESDNIIHIQEINNFHRVEYTKQGKYFKHNYARLGVFLTAKTRCNLAEIIDKYPNQILRCYTDSILSTVPLDIPISNKLGEWKLENSGKCIVKKNRKPNFIK